MYGNITSVTQAILTREKIFINFHFFTSFSIFLGPCHVPPLWEDDADRGKMI